MREAVVFLHGIWLWGPEYWLLRRHVAQCGFQCHQFRFHSLLRSPCENAAALDAYLKTLDADVIHLVGHSLGGIVILHLFDRYPMQKPGRVVMLSSPIKGSGLARRLGRYFFTRPLLGRSIERGLLGDAPRWKGARELGMIAGRRGFGVGSLLVGGVERPSDGTVAVSETRSPEINAHITMPHSHMGMLYAPAVARQVCSFLKQGLFQSPGS